MFSFMAEMKRAFTGFLIDVTALFWRIRYRSENERVIREQRAAGNGGEHLTWGKAKR